MTIITDIGISQDELKRNSAMIRLIDDNIKEYLEACEARDVLWKRIHTMCDEFIKAQD